jgi:hypothetical protein
MLVGLDNEERSHKRGADKWEGDWKNNGDTGKLTLLLLLENLELTVWQRILTSPYQQVRATKGH